TAQTLLAASLAHCTKVHTQVNNTHQPLRQHRHHCTCAHLSNESFPILNYLHLIEGRTMCKVRTSVLSRVLNPINVNELNLRTVSEGRQVADFNILNTHKQLSIQIQIFV